MSKQPGINKDKLISWLVALVFLVVGFGGTFLDWQVLFQEGEYISSMGFFAPLLGFLGLAMLVGPSGAEEDVIANAAARRRRAQRQRLALATFLAGLVVSGVNFALMSGWIGGLAG